jgi:hypothetical protein
MMQTGKYDWACHAKPKIGDWSHAGIGFSGKILALKSTPCIEERVIATWALPSVQHWFYGVSSIVLHWFRFERCGKITGAW